VKRERSVNASYLDPAYSRPIPFAPHAMSDELHFDLTLYPEPILRKQANAFLARPGVTGERFHYFDTGIKRLIIELELETVSIFLVHLSLKYRHRHFQLRHLYELVKRSRKPVIVAGDFNTFWGDDETFLFREALSLRSANAESLPSFPSRAPRLELDFILYGPGIEVSGFRVPRVTHSDHLPLVCDFETIPGRG
jgi:endonuclease/exonuclease/phosphatase family metal-dependent hydrolase